MPSTSTPSAASLDSRSGANPPSSPTAVLRPRSCNVRLSAWKTSAPVRRASAKVGAPAGTTMNSWKSTALSACAPPLSTFIIGTGSTRAPAPPRWRHSGSPASAAAAFAAASDTPRIAFAPRRPLFGVPSSVEHRPVHGLLVARVQALDGGGQVAVGVGHRIGHALAAPRIAAVAQLHGLELAGGRAGRHRGATAGARGQRDLDLDRGVAAAIQDLPGVDLLDVAHCCARASCARLTYLSAAARRASSGSAPASTAAATEANSSSPAAVKRSSRP